MGTGWILRAWIERRATRRGKAEVYPMPLWQRLPVVKVPEKLFMGTVYWAFGTGWLLVRLTSVSS